MIPTPDQWGWLGWVISIAGFFITYRAIYRVTLPALTSSRDGPDESDRVCAAGIAMCLSFMWPVMWVGYLVYLVATPTTTAEKVATAHRRRRELERMERETDRRLRELGKEH